ncbi:Protein MSN5 [Frankliniella fusca]|uniref:Protein MSN5 n=1 Tax=Frankliniella fusca TaxID=407009 RepID=A0AAE1L7G1_9NEOP|nr:Protein MSN5 [Frankliniella fusca]
MSKTNMEKIQKAENACIRFVTSATRFEHISPYYVQLGLLKYNERQMLAVATITRKIIKSNTPLYLSGNFSFSRRHENMLTIPIHRTTKYSNSFCISAIRLFNTYNLHTYINDTNHFRLKNMLRSSIVPIALSPRIGLDYCVGNRHDRNNVVEKIVGQSYAVPSASLYIWLIPEWEGVNVQALRIDIELNE